MTTYGRVTITLLAKKHWRKIVRYQKEKLVSNQIRVLHIYNRFGYSRCDRGDEWRAEGCSRREKTEARLPPSSIS